MTALQWLALAPLIAMTGVILVQMLLMAFARDLCISLACNVLAVATAGWALLVLVPDGATRVTPLLIVDGMSRVVALLILLSTLVVSLLSYDYLQRRDRRADEFLMLLLLAALGGLVLVASDHFASFILGLELMGVSLYALISYPSRGTLTVEAAVKYLILSGVSSALILFGAALLYSASGALDFAGVAVYNDVPSGPLLISAGVAMVFAGAMFKLSLVPFHMWSPDVYGGAPVPVTALLATASKSAVFVALLRLFIDAQLFNIDTLMQALVVVAVASMLVGNLLALRQDNIKRLLAYSSIAHLGYLLVAVISAGVAADAALAVEAAVFYLVAYVVTSLGAFAVISVLSNDSGEEDAAMLDDCRGLFWRRPALALLLTVSLLSLAGIPLTAGFIGKFYLFAAGVDAAQWLLLSVLILGSGIGVYYYLRIVFALTQRSYPVTIALPAAGGWVIVAVGVLIVWVGVWPAPVSEWIRVLL